MNWLGTPGSGWVEAMVRISELDVHDDRALRAFWDVEQAAQRADRTHAVLDTYDRRVQTVRQPAPGRERVLLAAYEGAELVGAAELIGSSRENQHLGALEVNVLPSHRRHGIGRALHDEAVRRGHAAGRTTFVGEACQPTAGDPSGAVSFALALGFESAHREEHLVLELPEWTETPPEAGANGSVVTWTNHAPDDLVSAYAVMRTQMNRDVPTGELDMEPRIVTADDIREEEGRLTQQYDVVVGVARRDDGVLDGYTLAFLPRGEDFVQQDDTFVRREARGRGIGRSLKEAVLRMLAAEHPERTLVHTWTAPDNDPMQRLNRGLGFRPVELMHEMQREDPRADG
jgi:GNAT superfamily N-acetyltransferase